MTKTIMTHCYKCKWYSPKGKIKGICLRWSGSPVLKMALDNHDNQCNEFLINKKDKSNA